MYRIARRSISRFNGKVREVNVAFLDGKQMRIECDKYALFADGSAVGTIGETSVSATAVSERTLKPVNFLPLTVNYQQKSASVARIPTNRLRREIGFTDSEILTGRLIDRSIRQLFPPGYFYDTQIVCKLVSSDKKNSPDVAAINATSAALHLSDIPWNGPIGAVRIAIKENGYIVNPDRKLMAESSFNIVVTSDKNKKVFMLEGSGNQATPVKKIGKAIEIAVKENLKIIDAIEDAQKINPCAKRQVDNYITAKQEHIKLAESLSEESLETVFTNYVHDKFARDAELQHIQAEIVKKICEFFPGEEALALFAYVDVLRKSFRKTLEKTQRRIDGRLFNELRDITCEVGLYTPLHGSGMFKKGQTRVMCSLTLDSLEATLKMDSISVLTGEPKEKNFFLHYEFPPYATGETGQIGKYDRREIGHGALAEKALRSCIPADFPFTIRLDAEVLESNGSSSMGTVCAGSLALMDGGLPILSPIAGVALGLVYYPESSQYTLLNDILGIEDFLGDMDFKIAGNCSGLTAMQLDIKLDSGIPVEVIKDALKQGYDANLKTLAIMSRTIKESNSEKKSRWPISETIEILPHKKGRVLGSNTVRNLYSILGARLTQDESEANKYTLFAPDRESFDEAKAQIDELLSMDDYEKNLEFKGIYKAKVVDVNDYGVKVTLHPGMSPVFMPNRELDAKPIKHASAAGIIIGSEISVKYFGRDPVSGQMRLSRRVVQALNPLNKNFFESD